MLDQIDVVEAVQASLVDEDARMDFLPKHVPGRFIIFESSVFRQMRSLCEEYDGGSWEFYELSNGGFFMAPKLGVERVKIDVVGNYYTGEMSPQAAGIVACLFVLCTMASRYEDDQLINQYHWLRDYALTHPETRQIMAAID